MSKFEESLASGKHQWLNKMAGKWEGVTKTWFEPDKLADESPMTGTIKPILGGKFIMHEYNGTMQGKPYEGISIYGYNMSDEKFESVNVDSFHTGTFIMMQQSDEGAEKFAARGNYYWKVSPEEIQTWGWRTELDLQDDDTLVLLIYNITPAGEEALAVETIDKRVK